MINGMTGFGSSSFFYNGIKYTLTLRSVNFKFLEIVINLPQEMASFDIESKIKELLSKHLRRGRIVVQLGREPESSNRELALNKRVLKKYVILCNEIKNTMGLKDTMRLKDVLGLPNIFYSQSSNDFAHLKFSKLLYKSLQKAAEKLLKLRRQEGNVIFRDLTSRIKKVKDRLLRAEHRVAQIVKQKRKSLAKEDFSDFLKSSNVQEEITRFKFFIKTFREKVKSDGGAGKMLDFIIQEMLREINTLNAKFRDKKAFYHCLMIKNEIEKIREQLQNVE